MLRFLSVTPKRAGFAMLLGGILFVNDAMSDVTYDVRAQTKDVVKNALLHLQTTNTLSFGKAKQGSFGAPSINDKGAVGYACVLSGKGITALTAYSVVVKLAGNRPAYSSIQSGILLPESFVLPFDGDYVPDTAYFYRLGINVAINDKNKVAFNGELIYDQFTPNGIVTQDVQSYGEVLPTNQTKPKFWNWAGMLTYNNFDTDFLKKIVSINSRGTSAFNGDQIISATKTVPSFGYMYPGFVGVIANTDTPVIGLPYFTTYQSFTDAIIADKNVAYIVAQLNDTGADFDGIWQGNNPDIQPVVILGDKAPDGGTFQSFGGQIGPSRDGKTIGFVAQTSTGGSGVFRAKQNGSDIIEIASLSDTAPTNDAVGNLGTFSDFTLASASNNGQVAVLGTVNAFGGTRQGIWLTDKTGANMTLIAVEGQSFTIKGTAKRLVKLAFNPVSGLNGKGQLAFTVSFGDRTSAVVVAHL